LKEKSAESKNLQVWVFGKNNEKSKTRQFCALENKSKSKNLFKEPWGFMKEPTVLWRLF
jgi:hypothetical protein